MITREDVQVDFTDVSIYATILFEDGAPFDIDNIMLDSAITHSISLTPDQLTHSTVDKLYAKAQRQYDAFISGEAQ